MGKTIKTDTLKKALLNDFYSFVLFMDVREESDPTKPLIPDIPLYKSICEDIQEEKDQLILLPRKFRKSLLVSQLYTIWYMLKYPNRTIGILTATYDLVTNITTGIKNFFNLHENFRKVFGTNLVAKATDKEIKLSTRTTTRKETNLKAYSMDAKNFAGFRCDLLIFDDVIDDEWRTATKGVKDKLINTFYAAYQMGEKAVIKKYLGTRFGPDDIAGVLLEKNKKHKTWQTYIESVYDEQRNAKHPEVMDINEIRSIEEAIPPEIFASQYLNTPIVSENNIFNIDNYGRYNRQLQRHEYRKIFFGIDISVMKNKDKGDFSAVVVVGKTPDGFMHILDGEATRDGKTDFYKILVKLAQAYKPDSMFFEAISGFEYAYDYFLEQSRKDNNYLPLHKISKQDKAKNDRLETTLEPLFRNHTLLLPNHQTKGIDRLIKEEMTYFDRYKPDNRDDMLDALEIAVSRLKEKGKVSRVRIF